MKVLHTINSLRSETGGPARSVPGLAGALVQKGVNVFIASPNPGATPLPDGVNNLPWPVEPAFLKDEKIDLIHDHGLWLSSNRQISCLARESGIPRIVSPRGMLEPWALNHRKWKKRMAWWTYQRANLRSANALHATSSTEAGQFRNLGLGMPVVVAANGVATFDRESQTFPRAKSEKRTALFLSRVHPKKGLPMLVEAWKKVSPTGWRMQVVGPDEGGHLAEVKKLVEAAGLEDSWSFEAPLENEQKWKAMAQADLFVLPTYSENFGIVVAEALVAGLPVITTHGAPWELLKREKCGWWVAPEANALAEALQDAVGRPDNDLARMGERGRKIVEKYFGWEKIAGEMTEAYEWLLGGGPKPKAIFDDQ